MAEVVAAGPARPDHAGTRVDVLVTREPRPGAPGGTDLALQDVEVLAATPAPADSGPPRIAASLRVTLRQAVYLAAAQSFARELRLLPRAAGATAIAAAATLSHDGARPGLIVQYTADRSQDWGWATDSTDRSP